MTDAQPSERWGAILSAMSDGLVEQGPDGRIRFWNPAAERILGLTGDQLAGRTSFDPTWHAVRADGSIFPGAEHPAMLALVRCEPILGTIMGIAWGQDPKARRWIRINAVPLARREDGRASGVVTTFADITAERIEAEQRRRLESLMERAFAVSGDMMVLTGMDGRFHRVNEAWTRHLGWTMTEMCAIPFLEFVHPDDHERTAREAAALFAGAVTAGFRNRYRHRDGRWRVLDWTAIREGDHLIGSARDVTDQAERQASLQKAKESAEAAAHAKSEFLATMSHEIRTPLVGVIGIAEALLDTTLDEEQREMLGLLHESGRSLLAILNDILDWSRMEAGRLEVQPVALRAADLIRDVVNVLEGQAKAKGLTLHVELGEPCPLMADPARLRQVLFNLVGNAVKFTPHGRVTVRWIPDREALTGRIEVEDSGIGIPPEALPHLFQRFTQVDATISRRYGGSGLGLAICRELVRLMSGAITVRSEPDFGSVFSVTLPLASH